MKIRVRTTMRPFARLLIGAGLLLMAGAGFSWFAGNWSEARDRAAYLAEAGAAERDAPPQTARNGKARAIPSTTAQAIGLGIIEIPRLKLTSLIRPTSEDIDLARGVGHVEGTALPGESGTIALAGHRDTFFNGLREIAVGDNIQLQVPGERKSYRVVEIKVVEPSNVSVLTDSPADRLVLITCFPFQYIGPAPRRFIVVAEPSTAPTEKAGRVTSRGNTTIKKI